MVLYGCPVGNKNMFEPVELLHIYIYVYVCVYERMYDLLIEEDKTGNKINNPNM